VVERTVVRIEKRRIVEQPGEDLAAAVVDHHETNRARVREVRQGPWRPQVIQRGEVAHEGPVLAAGRAQAEERAQLPVDAVGAAIGFDDAPARRAIGRQVPFTHRQAVAEVDQRGVGNDA
jgi:hypothetical protein